VTRWLTVFRKKEDVEEFFIFLIWASILFVVASIHVKYLSHYIDFDTSVCVLFFRIYPE
jgi:hypothetical protein